MKMKLNNLRRGWLAQILLGAAIVIALVVVVRVTRAQNGPVHMVTDWSHRHLIFSQPNSPLDGSKLSRDPRYVQQWIRRNAEKRDRGHGGRGGQPEPSHIQGDWNVYLGNPATVGAGNYPAKFSFDITAASCTSSQPDFVVYNTGLAGSDTAFPASDTGTFSAAAGPGSDILITNGGTTLEMIAGGFNTSVGYIGDGIYLGIFNTGSSAAASATNLAAAIDLSGNGNIVGVSATSSGAVVTLTATTGGPAGDSITVANGGTTNVTWAFSNFVDGATGVPTIVAFDNLYSGCGGTVPSTYWAYNTGSGATAATSVALSKDGTQVAFVQNAGAGAQLVLLKWAAGMGTVTDPIDLTGLSTNVGNSSYRGCTAPCMTTISFSDGAADSNSSPFYDYDPADDALYVGDDNGNLHQFTGVFLGTPGETGTTDSGIWPAVVNLGHVLTSPVYDETVGKIFVADNTGVLYSVDQTIGSGTGGIVATASLGTSGITDSPTVDASVGNVYVFVRGDNTVSPGPLAGVCQFSTSFAADATCSVGGGNEAQVSSSDGTLPAVRFFPGDFDNIYYSSGTGTGNMYVCGNAFVTGVAVTTVWQIPISAGLLGTPVQGPQLATANAECSPMTEFMNGATDRIFVSVVSSSQTAAPIDCPSSATGCIMSFNITTGTGWGTSTTTSATAGVTGTGGTSGIIIDSLTGPAGSSQIYFTPLASGACTTASGQGIGGCAIQASQATIQ
jgi:hypothetical protein